jgi:hypothetical protein
MENIQEHKICTSPNVINYHIFSFLNLKDTMECAKVNKLFYKSFKLYLSNLKKLDVAAKFNDRLLYFLLKNIKSLVRLEGIKINNKPINLSYIDIGKKDSQKKKKFKSLDIYNYNLIEMICKKMHFLKNLVSLNFSNILLYNEGFNRINKNINYLINLKELTFNENRITATYSPSWENYVLYLKELEVINFSNNDGQYFLVFLAQNINSFNNIKSLNFSYNPIYYDSADNIVLYLSTYTKKFELIIKSDLMNNSLYLQKSLSHLNIIN